MSRIGNAGEDGRDASSGTRNSMRRIGDTGDSHDRQPGTEEVASWFSFSLIEVERLLRNEPIQLVVMSVQPCFKKPVPLDQLGSVASDTPFASSVRSDRVLLPANSLSASSVSGASQVGG